MSEIINGKLHFEVSTIETIDQSVLNFVESLGLSTMTNKGFKPVPIIWGTAERSFQAKGNKEIRDRQGLLVLPIIAIKRASFTKSRESQGIFQGNVPEISDDKGGSLDVSRVLYQEKTMKFANADAYRLYGQKNFPGANPKVVYRTVTVPMPVNVEIMYEITLRTEYQQQMNDLMTPFATTPGTVNFVRLTEKDHKYEGFIQPDYTSTDNISDFSSDERKFETKINLKVIGYIVGEGPNREKPHYSIRENIVEVKIPRERISLAEIPEHEKGAYYGLSGISQEQLDRFFSGPVMIGNTPAASFFASGNGGGASSTSANVITTDNLAENMSNSMQIGEVLKAETDALPDDKRTFTTQFTIRDNTELVMLNGLIQASGADKDYTVSGKTILFTEDVELEDTVQITYIKS